MENKIIAASPAKINLFLEITGKREDGYHNIDSVMQEINLADTISFTLCESGDLNLTCNNPQIPTDNNNLVLKAATLLREEACIRLGANIHLEKVLPAGGGLGGGSGNAAVALKSLCKLWSLNISFEKMAEIALKIGSDVPFFLYGGTCRCQGRGEIIDRISPATALNYIVVFPKWGVSTVEAYTKISKKNLGKQLSGKFIAALEKGNIREISDLAFNRFEESVFDFCPQERELFESLARLDFECVRMSGSGSTLFGIVPPDADAEKLCLQAGKLDGVASAVVAHSA